MPSLAESPAAPEGWLGVWQGCVTQSSSPLPCCHGADPQPGTGSSPLQPRPSPRHRGSPGPASALQGTVSLVKPGPSAPVCWCPGPGLQLSWCPPPWPLLCSVSPASLDHQRAGCAPQEVRITSVLWAGRWGAISMACCPAGITAPAATAPGANTPVNMHLFFQHNRYL